MADSASSAFPKMGEAPLTSHLVNASGDRSPYTKNVARPAQGDAEAVGGTAIRGVGQMATTEMNGPVNRPVTTISYPNSPEMSKTGRGMRVVPSKTGVGDFWDNRYETGQVIA
jgi:hypothetical protein